MTLKDVLSIISPKQDIMIRQKTEDPNTGANEIYRGKTVDANSYAVLVQYAAHEVTHLIAVKDEIWIYIN